MSNFILSLVITLCTLSAVSAFQRFQLWHDADLTESCPKFQCKPRSMHFDTDTCIYKSHDTNYIHPCSSGQYCNATFTETNSTCVSPPIEEGISYPGEHCQTNDTCKFGYCLDSICRGKHWLETCTSTDECNAGLFCRKSTCWPLLTEAEACISDNECQNHLGCYKRPWEDKGECVPYFIVDSGYRTYDCINYTSRFCKSMTCMSPGGTGKGLCIDPPHSSKHLLDSCEKNSDCYAESKNYEFFSKCRCGLNSESQKYCSPFLGDESGQALTQLIKQWYSSDTIHTCHSTRTESQLCIRKWDKYNEFISSYYNFLHQTMYRNTESCVHKVFTDGFWDLN